jgi:hypothetical protein
LTRAGSLAARPEDLISAPAAKIHPIRDSGTIAGEFLAHVIVVVSHTLPVLRSVLPIPAVQRINARPIDVDIAVVPIQSAAPVISARPPVSKSPAGAKRKSGRDKSGADISWITPVIRRILWIRPGAVYDRGVVVRHVKPFRVGRLDRDDLPTLLLPLGHRLLLARGQLVVGIGFRAQALNGIHDICLLREDRIAQLLRPTKLLAHH